MAKRVKRSKVGTCGILMYVFIELMGMRASASGEKIEGDCLGAKIYTIVLYKLYMRKNAKYAMYRSKIGG